MSQELFFAVTAWFFISFCLGVYEHLPDLRHTFATHALASGVDAKTLSGILGHTNASFTLDTYAHVTGEMQHQAARVVGDYLTDVFGKELKPWQRTSGAAAAFT